MRHHYLVITIFILLSGPAKSVVCPLLVSAAETSGPRDVEAALNSFHLADDSLVIEVVASEPDVVSPVAIAWDEDGRMFVAEMNDYPTSSTGGRVKLLEELDERGRYRKATVYAEDLPFPNGVLPYKGGVFVTAAPSIWFINKDLAGRSVERWMVVSGMKEDK